MDENGPVSGSLLEKAWAVAGLLAGAALIFMAADLLRGPRPAEAAGDDS